MIDQIRIKEKKLDNGLVIKNVQLPFGRSEYMGFWVKAGTSSEQKKKYFGISHYLEHMLFNGSNKYSDHKKTGKIIAKNGIYENAWTWFCITHYYLLSPVRNFETGFDILLHRVTDPILSEAMVKKEKGIILEERKMVDNSPEDCLIEALEEKAFEGTTYGHPTLGYKDTIKGINQKLLKKYHDMFYSPNNMEFLTYGSMSFEQVEQIVTEKLESLKPADLWEHDFKKASKYKVEHGFDDEGNILLKKDVESSFYQYILKLPKITTVDQFIALFLLETILSNGRASLLNQKLVLDKSLVSSYSFEVYALRDFSAIFAGAVMDEEKRNEVRDILKKSVKEVLDVNFDDADFSRAKNYLLGLFLRNFENVWSSNGVDLTNISRLNILNDTKLTPAKVIDAIESAKLEEMRAIWTELIDLDDIVEGSVVSA